MPSAADLTIGKRFLGLFVGESGSGKTPSACSFVDSHPTKRVYVFDFDGRLETLLNTPWIDRSRIDYDYYPPLTEKLGTATWEKVNTKLENLQYECSKFICNYNTIILDSLKSQTFAFLNDAMKWTHGSTNKQGSGKGKTIGPLNMAGPEDYGFESTGTQQLIAFLRSLPIQNIIVTSHLIDRYEKDNPEDMMSPSHVAGQRLALRDKLAASIPGDFNHVFRFERKVIGGKNKVSVIFWDDLARSVYPNLPSGRYDITDKSFYSELMQLAKQGVDKVA